jgi:exodeoxyribonuclease V alpha subunit
MTSNKYERLVLRGAWQRFETARGGQPRHLERRLRALEEKAGDLNLERDSIHLAAELASLQANLDDDTRYALIVLIIITLAVLGQGSTRFPVAGEPARTPMRRMLATLIGPDEAECELVRDAIGRLLRGNLAPAVIGHSSADRLPLLFVDSFIAHERSYQLEHRLVDSVTALRKRSRPFAESRVGCAIDDVFKRPAVGGGGTKMEFSAEQARAIDAAVSSRLSLISGGPGTGKTSIVIAILRVLARLGIGPNEVALAAPTGRAAFRMREAIATSLARVAEPSPEDEMLRITPHNAGTVHRLLGYSPERGAFLHHRNNPIAARVVIVDEGSMLDLAVMERLFSALAENAQLVILGDADQLPSVSAGAAFRDLLPSDRSHPLFASSVRLTHNYRTQTGTPAGAAIVEVCTSINAGDSILRDGADSSERHPAKLRANVDEVGFEGVELLPALGEALDEFLDRWDREHVAGNSDVSSLAAHHYEVVNGIVSDDDRASLARFFEYRARARILCVTRVGALGSEAINVRMHHRAARRGSGVVRGQPMIAGEPVIVVCNDYERALFNGEQGVVVNSLETEGRRSLAAVFTRGNDFLAFRLDTLRDLLELGYATTVHKAQGSEFDIAALLLPDHDLPVLTRELLYTAVSRCRRGMVIVGEPSLLAAGIARKAERYSGVAETLVARFQPRSAKQLEFDLGLPPAHSRRK